MAKVALFFKASNKNEHLASSFLPRECGHVLTTVKRLVGRPRKRKPSAETPPVPNIDSASEILHLSANVGQEAKRIRCQYTTNQKMHVVMRADRTRSHYSNKCPPNVGAL